MTLTLYMPCNTLICIILSALLVSSKIIFSKSLVEKIIEAKVAENDFFLLFSVTLNSNIFWMKSLNKVILDYSDKPNRIAQINVLHDLYNVKVIEIFDVEVAYAIHSRVYTSRHYGCIFLIFLEFAKK